MSSLLFCVYQNPETNVEDSRKYAHRGFNCRKKKCAYIDSSCLLYRRESLSLYLTWLLPVCHLCLSLSEPAKNLGFLSFLNSIRQPAALASSLSSLIILTLFILQKLILCLCTILIQNLNLQRWQVNHVIHRILIGPTKT